MSDCELGPIFALLWSNDVGFSFICCAFCLLDRVQKQILIVFQTSFRMWELNWHLGKQNKTYELKFWPQLKEKKLARKQNTSWTDFMPGVFTLL